MASDWIQPVDIYCERISADFWAEPVNALSNLAFLLAAWCAFRAYQKAGIQSRLLRLAIGSVALTGIGSFIFHTFATAWAMMADVLPIMVSMLMLLFILLSQVFVLRWPVQIVLIALFFVSGSVVSILVPFDLNGSEEYLPAWLTLVLSWWFAHKRALVYAPYLSRAALLLTLSLCFRTSDMAVCSSFPLGTHFVWHALNGWMYYFLLVGLVRFHQQKGTFLPK